MGSSCGAKRPAYHKKLHLLFKGDPSSATGPLYQDHEFTDEEIKNLSHQVAKPMKGIIDYLATNQHAIVPVGLALSKHVQSKSGQEAMISILAFLFIVQNLSKYKMGTKSLKKMIKEKKMKKVKRKHYKEAFVRDMAEQSLVEHLLMFEGTLLDSVIFVLSGGDVLTKNHKVQMSLVLSTYLSNIERVEINEGLAVMGFLGSCDSFSIVSSGL